MLNYSVWGCCNTDTLPPPWNYRRHKFELKNRQYKTINYIAYSIQIFLKAPSLSLHVYIRGGDWHTDLSLGWRPGAREALAAVPWETGGRHQNVITAAKLLSIKAKLQKYVPWGPTDHENRASFEWLRPEECSGSCPALCLVVFTISKALLIPQLLADIMVHVWDVL